MIKKCVFAGTFDPPTVGHKALIEDCLCLFDEVAVVVMVNPAKKPFFTTEQRTEMLGLMFDDPRVKISWFFGTAAELLVREGTDIYVRGVRNPTDFEYEISDSFASAKLNKDMKTVFLPCRQELLHVSSTLVRNSLLFSSPIEGFVTKEVEEYIYAAEREKRR